MNQENNNSQNTKKIQETKKIREILDEAARQVLRDQEISQGEGIILLGDLNDIGKKYQCRECEKVTDNEALVRIGRGKSKYDGHYHRNCFRKMIETKEQEQITKQAKEHQQSVIILSGLTLFFGGVAFYFWKQKDKFTAKLFGCLGLGLLITTISYALTNSLWSILLFPILALIGWAITKNEG